jgi:hypothetical protein
MTWVWFKISTVTTPLVRRWFDSERIISVVKLQSTDSHWARVVGYGSFSLCVIHKEGLCPSSGGINRLMMMTAATAV